MDSSIDPCDDFFKFACGGFLRKKVIPEGKTSFSRFSEANNILQENLRGLIEAEVAPDDPPSTKLVKALQKSCMHTEAIKARGLKPLKDTLSRMGGWPVVQGQEWDSSAFQWTTSVYINRKLGYPHDHIFDFYVDMDFKKTSRRIIIIDQPSLGMPSREYLLKGFTDSDVQAYYQYQVSMATLLGADKATAEKELKESLEFEIQLAKFSLPKEERRDVNKLYNLMTIKELKKMVPQIPWRKYINRMLRPFFTVTNVEPVVVLVPTFLTNMGKLLDTTPKRVIANYMLWRVAMASAKYLSEDARAVELEYLKKLKGKQAREPRWQECMGYVTKRLPHAVGSMYARKFFKEDAKAAADDMVKYIRAEFEKILRNVDWMDESTRTRALEKAKSITPNIAYPPELLMEDKLAEFYDGLEMSSKNLLANMRNINIFAANNNFKKLREQVLKNDWRDLSQVAVINAFYSPLDNSIRFPAGILQGAFFAADRPKYMNYGAIGYVIGHEITHGFDDMGRQFDANGDLRDWWEAETKQKFLEKAKCIIYQYGNYTVPELKMNLNGINTQGENIADNGGIKEAYMAYNQWTKDHGMEQTLPNLSYTPRQLFWMSAANVWCMKYRPEILKLSILMGVHSPAQFRVNGPLSNLPEFARDWQCPVGSKLNPTEKCSVW